MDQRVEPKRRVNIRISPKDISFCNTERIFLIVEYDKIHIYDADIGGPLYSIKLVCSPKFSALSPCGKYFCIHENSNNVLLYETATGEVVQRVTGAPYSTKDIKFSGNSRKLIFGSTQLLCLWSITQAISEMRTEVWRNINCYDINHEGNRFALGTYNGGIYILDFIERGKCTQIQIKRHSNCVMCICFHKNQLISASHDCTLLVTTVSTIRPGEKSVQYLDMKLQYVPKSIKSVGDKFYLFDPKGMTWLSQDNTLVGFTDGKVYGAILNQEKQVIFVNYHKAKIEWWQGKIFKGFSQLQKENVVVHYRMVKGQIKR